MLDAVHADLDKVAGALANNEMREFLLNPVMEADNKKDVISKLAGELELCSYTTVRAAARGRGGGPAFCPFGDCARRVLASEAQPRAPRAPAPLRNVRSARLGRRPPRAPPRTPRRALRDPPEKSKGDVWRSCRLKKVATASRLSAAPPARTAQPSRPLRSDVLGRWVISPPAARRAVKLTESAATGAQGRGGHLRKPYRRLDIPNESWGHRALVPPGGACHVARRGGRRAGDSAHVDAAAGGGVAAD